jgi:hypothetical protein
MGLGGSNLKKIWVAHTYHHTKANKYNREKMVMVIDVTAILR